MARRRRLEELPVGLLVVDCLSALITPILGGGQHSQGHALLAATAASLKAFAARSGAGRARRCTQLAALHGAAWMAGLVGCRRRVAGGTCLLISPSPPALQPCW